MDNHWALRDFASRLMANICKNFNSSTNSVQTRVTRVFSEAMRTERNPLVCYYGAIAGLQVRERYIFIGFVSGSGTAGSNKLRQC